MVTPTWLEALVDELAGLGDEFNTALAAAELPALVDWYSGEPRPIRSTDTPYGWWHYRPGDEVSDESRKHAVASTCRVVIAVVLGGGTAAELVTSAAQILPRLQAVLESRSWATTNAGVSGFELVAQDREVHTDLWALPLDLTYWRPYGSTA